MRFGLIALKIIVNVCRLLLAGTFIFSGFVKGNDPLGMVYKIEDYLTAFSIEGVPSMLVLSFAIMLAMAEFVIGVYLLFGISKGPVARLTLTFMSVMTLFTVYIFIYNPVSDCGCFGDAVVLSNGETLLKNIVLLGASIVVLRWKSLQIRLLSDNTEWIVSLYAIVYILGYSLYCHMRLPAFDYRPYHVGADLRVGTGMGADDMGPVYDVKIVYERDGEQMELDIDDEDPDSTWTYVETKRTLVKEAGKADMTDFYIIDQNQGVDITEMVLGESDYTFLLVAPLLEQADQSRIDLINESYDYSLAHGYGYYCITASDSAAQKFWIDHTGAEYDIYRGDERALKTVVRSNPGLVLLKDGKVVHKWSSWNLPDEYELCAPLEELSIGKIEVLEFRQKVMFVTIIFFLPLVVLTILDRLAMKWAFYRMMKRKSKELKLEEIEKKLGLMEENNNDINTNNKSNS